MPVALACAALLAMAPAPKPLGPEAARLSNIAFRVPLADRARATRRIATVARIAAHRLSRPEVSNLVSALHRDNAGAPARSTARSDRRWLAAQLSIALVRHGVLLRPRTLNTLVTACARAGERAGDLKTGDLEIARELVALADDPSTRVRPYSNATLTRLLVALTRAGDSFAAADLARSLAADDSPRDLPLYNAILRAMLDAGVRLCAGMGGLSWPFGLPLAAPLCHHPLHIPSTCHHHPSACHFPPSTCHSPPSTCQAAPSRCSKPSCACDHRASSRPSARASTFLIWQLPYLATSLFGRLPYLATS